MSRSAKILGLGVSRTGTWSLKNALMELGFSTAHFLEHLEVFRGRDTWFRGHFEVDELKGLDAAVDLPIPVFFRELDRRYPGSRFILTVREPGAWLKSMRALFAHLPVKGPGPVRAYRKLIREGMFSTVVYDEARLLDAVDRHVAAVRAYFRDRESDILVLDLCGGEGWNELCGFLDVPAPATAFPWVNVREGYPPAPTRG